jgi:hypothetical protein
MNHMGTPSTPCSMRLERLEPLFAIPYIMSQGVEKEKEE